MWGNQSAISPEITHFLIINDADQCEDNDHVTEFSKMIDNDFKRLVQIEFQKQRDKMCYFFYNRPAGDSWGPWGLPGARRNSVGDP